MLFPLPICKFKPSAFISLYIILSLLLNTASSRYARSPRITIDGGLRPLKRRRLASFLNRSAPTASLHLHEESQAAYKVQRDWVDDELDVSYPELYYQDLEDGSQQLIWKYDDTLARDAVAGQSDVWLHASIDVDADADMLPHFLDHYSRLGISPEHMIFTLHHHRHSSNPSADAAALAKIQSILALFGADHRLSLGEDSQEGIYESLLIAIQRVPIKDWIITARGYDFVEFDGLTARKFLDLKELEGANWVAGRPIEALAPSGSFEKISFFPPTPLSDQFSLECSFKRIDSSKRSQVVAFRGYLRPTIDGNSIVPAEHATEYFGASNDGEESFRGGTMCGTKDLHALTPYALWWQYYKTPLMVGNAYLWYERKAEESVALYKYRWHHGIVTGMKSGRDEIENAWRECEAAPRLDQVIFVGLVNAERVVLSGVEVECETKRAAGNEKEGQQQRLPLNKRAAVGLAAALKMYS